MADMLVPIIYVAMLLLCLPQVAKGAMARGLATAPNSKEAKRLAKVSAKALKPSLIQE